VGRLFGKDRIAASARIVLDGKFTASVATGAAAPGATGGHNITDVVRSVDMPLHVVRTRVVFGAALVSAFEATLVEAVRSFVLFAVFDQDRSQAHSAREFHQPALLDRTANGRRGFVSGAPVAV